MGMSNHLDSTGRAIQINDFVTVKGSTILREVVTLFDGDATHLGGKTVRATRVDGKDVSWSVWSHAKNLTVVR